MRISQRFYGEHPRRFFKPRLLVTRFLAPDAGREERWWPLTQLASIQRWVARHQVPGGRYPWQQHLPVRL